MEEKVPPKKARQGRQGLPVLMVLVGGLLLAAIAWGIAELYGNSIDERQPVETQKSTDLPLEAD